MKYYVDENDFIFCENRGKVYSYDYVKNSFVLADKNVNLIKWHEISKSDVEKNVENNKYLFS